MDVIPLILDEEAIDLLSDEILDNLAKCSTNIVLQNVVEYLSKADADKKIADRVEKHFRYYIESEELLNDEEMKFKMASLNVIDYRTITPGTPIDLLKKWKNLIEYVFNEEKAIPYKQPIKGGIIRLVEEDVKGLYKDTKNRSLFKFLQGVRVKRNLFSDSYHAYNRGTIFKTLIRERQKYEIILYGIDFQLKVRADGRDPRSWRYL